MDEKYLGHVKKFVTIVIDGYTGELLWLKEGKNEASLSEFFAGLNDEQRADIKFVSLDRSNSYLSAVRKWLPHASVSFDHFHLIANLNSAIDDVRKQICRDKEKEERKVMKGKRFLLFRSIECMNEDSRKLVDEQLSLNKPLSEAFLLKEGFRKFLKAETFRLAAAGFRKWILMVRKSTLQPFQNLATTLTRNRRQVLHTLRYRLSSGRIEGG
ncbi:MAG: transposase [Akkermansia muciniphila]